MVGGTDRWSPSILQIGFAGYGAFYVASKVDGDGKTIDEDAFIDGFGIHMPASATSSWLLGARSSS